MIKAVIFDIDGVLIDSFDVNHKFYNEIFERNGYKTLTVEEFKPYFPMTMWDVIATATKANETDIKRIFEDAKNNIEYPSESLQSQDGAQELLETLSNDYLLGIVTSKLKDRLFRIPILGKNKELFDVVVAHEDTKKHKPDPEPLILACKKLGIDPSEAIYVGDQESDILAARGAGMKVLLFSRENFGNPDIYTPDLKEIPQLISML